MRALTLWQPWAWAILHLPSDIAKPAENRDWMPPRSLLGQRIAIHGGKRYDGLAMVRVSDIVFQRAGSLPRGVATSRRDESGILGTVRLVGVVEDRRGQLELVSGSWGETSRAACVPWFVGRYGWVLDQRRVLDRPIPCAGKQGLWTVPDEIAARLA